MTSKKITNSEIEKFYFEKFREVYPLPDCEVVYQDAPDVVLKTAKETIGIEITNLYIADGEDGDSEQRQNPIRIRALKEAHSLFKKKGGKNLELSLSFNLISSLEGLSNKLSDLALSIQDEKSGMICSSRFEHIPEISYLFLNSQEYEHSEWRLTQVHSTPFINPEQLLKVIAQKTAKAKKYTSCDAYWLLFVVDFINFAQDQEIMNFVLPNIESKFFKKIIIFKTGYNQIRELF